MKKIIFINIMLLFTFCSTQNEKSITSFKYTYKNKCLLRVSDPNRKLEFFYLLPFQHFSDNDNTLENFIKKSTIDVIFQRNYENMASIYFMFDTTKIIVESSDCNLLYMNYHKFYHEDDDISKRKFFYRGFNQDTILNTVSVSNSNHQFELSNCFKKKSDVKIDSLYLSEEFYFKYIYLKNKSKWNN